MAKILIVEDNALNIKLFCDLLAAHGHQPEAVTDSRVAIDAAREFSPDLVITDIQLPHVSGLDLIRLIRKDEELAGVPIMAVTAYSARGDEERIRAAGAQAYVSKPISVMKFAQTVDDLLKDSEADVNFGVMVSAHCRYACYAMRAGNKLAWEESAQIASKFDPKRERGVSITAISRCSRST